MFEGLSILAWLCATIGTIVFGGLVIFDDNGRQYIIWLLVPVVGILGVMYSWDTEQGYYKQYGNPYVMYGQIKAVSDNRVTLYGGNQSQGKTKNEVFIRGSVDFARVKQEDTVRLTYLSGFYHDFAIKVEKLEVVK